MNPQDGIPKIKRVSSTAERLKALPYEKRVCRAEYYPSCLVDRTLSGTTRSPDDVSEQSIKEYLDFILEVGMEVQVVSGEIDRGTPRFPSKMIPAHPNISNELLPKFLELAHQKGIIVLSYYPISYNKPLKAIHPEWLMEMLDDGRPPIVNQGWWCFNSPFRNWLPNYLIEFLDNLDLDGFYFDDTNWGSHGDLVTTTGQPLGNQSNYPSCCCKYCEKLFLEETGLQMPRKVNLDSLDFRHFMNWRYKKWRKFIRHIFRTVKEKHPDAILDVNTYYWPSVNWTNGHPLGSLGLEEMGGHFFTESFLSLRDIGFVSKVLRSTGTPFSIWRQMHQTSTENAERTTQQLNPYDFPIHGMTTIANGGKPIFATLDNPILQRNIMKPVFNEIKKRADYIQGETLKYVALHYSQQNRDFRPSESLKNQWNTERREIGQKDTYGAYEILDRSHLLFDFIFDEQITIEKLSKYRVLFLSNSACLSSEQCGVIKKFVNSGGTLIATHETSLLDELGQRRDNFALSDVFGVNYVGLQDSEAVPGSVYLPQDKTLSSLLDYLIIASTTTSIPTYAGGATVFLSTATFAGQESSVSLKPGADVQVLCSRSQLKRDNPMSNFNPQDHFNSSEPAVVLHRFGQGQSIYISGDVGGGYMHNPYPPLKRFVARLVRTALPPIEFEAPEALQVTAAYRSPDELMIHLVNNPTPLLPWRISNIDKYNKDMNTFHYLNEVNPINNVRIQINDLKVKSARLPLENQTLDLTENCSTIIVPEIKFHQVVLLEL